MLAPPAAYYSIYDGEKLSLQFLLLISSLVGLTIGAAISDRKRAITALKLNELELEQQLRDRTSELEQSHEFQKHLLRSIGHDMKQPVQSINLMLDSHATEFTEAPKGRSLERAKNVGRSAAIFVDKVLDFAKRDAGRIDVYLEQVAVSQVFDLLEETYEPIAAAKDVNLVFEQTSEQVLTDQVLLFEALSNLVENSVRLSSATQKVAVTLSDTSIGFQISVIDQIKGIDGNGVKQTRFGLEIVKQISSMIGAEFEQKPNLSTITISVGKSKKLA